jgi:dipeptidyl aminopeptidase/acylaminoacyl peptidase
VLLANGEAPRADIGLVSLGKDGTTLIYSERKENDELTRLFEVPLDGSAEPREFMTAEAIDQLILNRTTGALLGFWPTGSDGAPTMFDPALQAKVRKIYAAFPKLDVSLMDWTADLSHVLVRTTGNGDSGTWYVIDIDKMAANAVGYERLAIEPQYVGKISTVAYKAGDGIDLDGILTLPPGRDPKGLPLVVFPHGGPHSQDEEAFDWWAQAFASRGYAVFQPNFRGSTNRDEAFRRASYGQWGRKMQTDLSDGVAELARQGIVDPERVCIMGASYGGYAALAGVTLQQGVYRCAVAVAGVSDLGMLYTDELRGGGSRYARMDLKEELGTPDTHDAASPRHAAARADAPILLIHGRDDTVVPFRHSKAMADALKDAREPYELVELKEEDHWLSRAETRKLMLAAATSFVLQHNPPE